jgi:hypothetical protein
MVFMVAQFPPFFGIYSKLTNLRGIEVIREKVRMIS